jgi:hypothetical protein
MCPVVPETKITMLSKAIRKLTGRQASKQSCRGEYVLRLRVVRQKNTVMGNARSETKIDFAGNSQEQITRP